MPGDVQRFKRFFALSCGGVILLLIFGTWVFGGFDGMTTVGVFSLLIGEIVAVTVGVGLMTLVFYSSSSEQDETVYHLGEDRRDR